jgi:hypothetical protein
LSPGRLQQAVHAVESTCSRLGERAAEAEQAHSELTSQVELLEETAEETKDPIGGVSNETSELHRLLRNLTGQVHQIEYRMRGGHCGAPADLDSIPGAAGHTAKIATADEARAHLGTGQQTFLMGRKRNQPVMYVWPNGAAPARS